MVVSASKSLSLGKTSERDRTATKLGAIGGERLKGKDFQTWNKITGISGGRREAFSPTSTPIICRYWRYTNFGTQPLAVATVSQKNIDKLCVAAALYSPTNTHIDLRNNDGGTVRGAQ